MLAAEFGANLLCYFGQSLVRSVVPIFRIRREANQNFLAVHFRRTRNSLEESLGQTLQNEIVSASFRKERIVPGNDYYSRRKRSSNSVKQSSISAPHVSPVKLLISAVPDALRRFWMPTSFPQPLRSTRS